MSHNSAVIDIAPAVTENLPNVAVPMIRDFLAHDELLHFPAAQHRTLHWIVALPAENVSFTQPKNIDPAHLLHICPAEKAEQLLSEHKNVLVCALASPDYDCSGLVTRYDSRLIAVRLHDTYERFVTRLHAYFTRLFMWEVELERLVNRGGSLTDMLNTGATVFKNFTFISDNDFNVVAHTTQIDPPDKLHRTIVKNGCLTFQDLNEDRYRLPERAFYTKEATETQCAHLSRPLYLNHEYLCSVSMACHELPLTEGLKDLFSLFVKYVIPLMQRLWREQVELSVPHFFFFERLLSHDGVTDEYVRMQMRHIKMSEDADLKVVAVEVDMGVEPEKARRVMRAGASLNKGRVFCLPYQGIVVFILHTPPSDAELSHRVTIAELEERICEPYDVTCGVSETFKDIANLDLAFRQASAALSFKQAMQRERFAQPNAAEEGLVSRRIYLFGNVLYYYLLTDTEHDQRFLRFCFQHTIVHILYEEDKRNGTNILALFWFYLYYERNATKTAEHLHMHRNTVLYHIEKIQKRFDFDLSWHVAREHMRLEFKAFFLHGAEGAVSAAFATESAPHD